MSASKETFAAHARLDCRLTSEAKSCCFTPIVLWAALSSIGTPTAGTALTLAVFPRRWVERTFVQVYVLWRGSCRVVSRPLRAYARAKAMGELS